MCIRDRFSIKGRGTVVTGRVDRGVLTPNSEIDIIGLGNDRKKVVVTSMEMFHKVLDKVEAGDNAGLLLRGVGREEVERGQVLAKPNSMTPHTEFMGEVYAVSYTHLDVYKRQRCASLREDREQHGSSPASRRHQSD